MLDGTDVASGAARAVVVAVGEDTRMGAIAAALAEDSNGDQSPLDERLGRMLVSGLPWIGLGGLMVTGAGLLRGRSALSSSPSGPAWRSPRCRRDCLSLRAWRRPPSRSGSLPVTPWWRGSRLSRPWAAWTSPASTTGTLTTGTLELTLVADAIREQAAPDQLSPELGNVLRAAAVASPSPDALDAAAHPTDVAILHGARAAGVDVGLSERDAESPFDPARSFHATLAGDLTRVKGAVEALAERCTRIRRDGAEVPLDDAGRAALLDRAGALAGQGLRILLVAEGETDAAVEDPRGLTALGFVGISDPLRPGAAAAVQRCRDAGVRVVMLTGDHPATAKAIARGAGIPTEDARMLTGEEVSELDDATLAQRLQRATVIARTTPLQKLRIVEALRSAGHVVAMTGDGVNDAPALRLADVGVAMGRGGTEVARQSADLVLSDDEFSTLTEALVEGRGFWHNMRRALGLLLGGNAGEVGLMIASALVGLPTPLTTRQVLTVNLVTDVFPAVSVAVQPPEHRNLAELSREGGSALDAPLRADVIRRGIATSVPSFCAYVLAARIVGPVAGRTVAYISIVTTQLAQTIDLGQAEGRLTSSVLGAVGGSLAVLAATVMLPGVRTFLGLSSPTLPGVVIAGGASALALVLVRVVPVGTPLGTASAT